VAVTALIELVFSHAVDRAAFESALTVTPGVDYTISYDDSGSFATITFDGPLDYSTDYRISLPAGTYGANGEASTGAVDFSFTTQPFTAPVLTLEVSEPTFFEGDSVTLTATISFAIFSDVTFDLVPGGTATPEEDYSLSTTSVSIPAGETSATITVRATDDGVEEGGETITLGIDNIVNAETTSDQTVTIALGDQLPAIALKGVMSLKIGGTSTNGRAVHLVALEDIPDLSRYGIGIANNGGGSDGREISLSTESVVAGDNILLVRDRDREGLASYFGDCISDFAVIVESDGLNFNGDDPFELYRDSTVIETYGDVEVAGDGLEWEYTGSWAYKLDGRWEYAAVDCSAEAATYAEVSCKYPFCIPLQIQGALALLWEGSGNNGGKAIHLRANRDIADLSAYGVGVANNGGGTDGVEITLPAEGVAEGAHILIAREPATLAGYIGDCYGDFDLVLQSGDVNQNGDDAIELFQGTEVVDTYGDADVDGTDQVWEYSGSFGYRFNGVFSVPGLDCAAGSTSTQSSSCPYGLCR
jgi:hypothetical protein